MICVTDFQPLEPPEDEEDTVVNILFPIEPPVSSLLTSVCACVCFSGIFSCFLFLVGRDECAWGCWVCFVKLLLRCLLLVLFICLWGWFRLIIPSLFFYLLQIVCDFDWDLDDPEVLLFKKRHNKYCFVWYETANYFFCFNLDILIS